MLNLPTNDVIHFLNHILLMKGIHILLMKGKLQNALWHSNRNLNMFGLFLLMGRHLPLYFLQLLYNHLYLPASRLTGVNNPTMVGYGQYATLQSGQHMGESIP